VLPKGSYEWRKIDGEIVIKGGGSIMLFGLDDPARIASMNLSGCGVDEAVDLGESDWTMLRGRIRLSMPGLPNQLYGACNPSTPQHWLAQRFGIAGGHTAAHNCEAITTSSRDNWFLPADYLEDLESMTGVARKRYVEGLWCGSDGLVYDRWEEEAFVVDTMPEDFDEMIVGMDEGYNNPAVLLLLARRDGRVFVIDEWYERRRLEEEVVGVALEWQQRWPIDCFVVDPSAAKLRAAMRHAGMDVQAAKNPVFAGIQTVASLLSFDTAGVSKLAVHRRCSNLIREFGSYEWSTGADGSLKDTPNKSGGQDHALDSLRYACVHWLGLRTQPAVRMVGQDSEPIDDNTPLDPVLNEDLWTEI